MRDPRVPWLGSFPSTWRVERGRFLFLQLARAVRPEDGVVTAFRDGQVTLRENRRTEGFMVAIKEHGYQGVRVGDLVIHSMDAFAGAIGVSESDGKCTPEYIVMQPQCSLDVHYYAYLLREMARQEYILVICPSVRERAPRFRYSRFKDVFLPVPPPETQRAIAAYLDRKTAAIDELIASKQRLIELLEEKRAALINQAVTRGLNPDVPMKDSGVPWIGEIPAHWDVKRLKYLLSFVTSGSRGWARYYSEQGPAFIRIGNISSSSIEPNLADIQRVSLPDNVEGVRTRVEVGDLLVSITANVGSVCVISEDLGEAYVSQHVALARPQRGAAYPRWLGYFLSSQTAQAQFSLTQYGGTKVGLALDDIGNMVVCLPEQDEQETILSALERKLASIDESLKSLLAQITRFNEYRQALITAAVTGQINVLQPEPREAHQLNLQL